MLNTTCQKVISCSHWNRIIFNFIFFSKHRAALREILVKTNLIVMIDDPIISSNLEEFLLQFQSGLTMGSITSGLVTPQGSLLLTSNTDVTQRFD